MEEFLQFAQTYRWALGTAGAVLAGLILLFYLARILRQIKRLNKSLGNITENIQAYFDVILREDEEEKGQEKEQPWEYCGEYTSLCGCGDERRRGSGRGG